MRLVENWRTGHRWFSNQSMFIAICIQGAWSQLDADQRASLPHNFVFYLTVAVLALGIAGRFIVQSKKEDPPCSDSSQNT